MNGTSKILLDMNTLRKGLPAMFYPMVMYCLCFKLCLGNKQKHF